MKPCLVLTIAFYIASFICVGCTSEEKEQINQLIRQLSDEDTSVRRNAAFALGEIGPSAKPAVPTLLATLNDKNTGDSVRQDAAEALGKIGDTSAVPALIAALNDSGAWVRRNAVWASGEIGDERAIPALIEALKDSDEWIPRDAANALGKIGTPALPPLIAGLKREKQQGHRYADALVKMGEPAVPALTELMNDADAQVRRYAAWALRRIGRLTTDAVPTSRRIGPPEAKKAIEDYRKPR